MAFMPSQSRSGVSTQGDARLAVSRSLPEEVPVAMVYDGTTQAVMMATPGDIADFAYGFALTEGIVTSLDQIESFEEHVYDKGIEARIWLRDDRSAALKSRRRFMAGPVGCGLCGIDSVEQAVRPLPVVKPGGFRLSHQDVARAAEELRAHQPLHDLTRAVHAAGFLRPGEGLLQVREDVGRHNALDKLIGAMARHGIDAGNGALVLTSRVSVEMVQKCAMAGCPALISVSAPTAHALRLAEEAGITLATFVRNGGFDLYSHKHRITSEVTNVA